jgi:hypothetical protein
MRKPSRAARDEEVRTCSALSRDKFWSKVEKTETCWLYQSPVDGYGYGRFFFESIRAFAHRASLIWATDQAPGYPQRYACHTCPKKNCVNPNHLYWGTALTNMHDAIASGARDSVKKKPGHIHFLNKHTKKQVIHLWDSYHKSKDSVKSLAGALGFSTVTAYKILSRKSYTEFTSDLDGPRKPYSCSRRNRGTSNYFFKLSEEIVREIIHRLMSGESVASIARRKMVNWTTINKIKHNKSWRHVPRGPDCQ